MKGCERFCEIFNFPSKHVLESIFNYVIGWLSSTKPHKSFVGKTYHDLNSFWVFLLLGHASHFDKLVIRSTFFGIVEFKIHSNGLFVDRYRCISL